MLKIVDNKIYRDGQKLGWLDGHHVRDNDGAKLGYFQDNCVYNEAAHKLAYTHEDDLMFENGNETVSLEHVNAHVEGAYPLAAKCAVLVLMEE